MTDVATPVAAVPRERLEILDAVRGAAVLGILFVNIESLSGYGFATPEARASAAWSRWNDAAALFIAIFIEGKFYALFSLLFGVGFAVFIERAAARGGDAVRLFKRRLAGLLLIGLIHTLLIWYGDILLTYAVLGFGLIPFLRKDDRTLLRTAAILFVLPAVLYALGALALAFVDPGGIERGGPLPPVLAQAADHFAHGSYPEVVAGNVVFTVANLLRRIGLMFFPRVFGMFLVGFYIGRSGMLRDMQAHRPLLRRLVVVGAVAGLPLAVVGAVLPDRLPPAAALLVDGISKSAAIPALTFGYAAAFCLIFGRSRLLRRSFAAPGRMALSNYLMHSLVGIAVFYGLGFGWYGKLSLASVLVFAVALFGLQIAISVAWLRIAAFGPAEWLWRMFTYRRRFPLLATPRAES